MKTTVMQSCTLEDGAILDSELTHNVLISFICHECDKPITHREQMNVFGRLSTTWLVLNNRSCKGYSKGSYCGLARLLTQ